MTSATTHPLAASWVRDLELLLYGIEPGERAEVLAGVHEHLDASLPPGSTDADVRTVLTELGSPQSVADEAYAGRPAPPAPRVVRPSPWLAYCACVVNGLMLVLMGFLSLIQPHAVEWLGLLMTFTFPWVFLIVMTSMTEVWSPTEKFVSIGLAPGTITVSFVISTIFNLTPARVLIAPVTFVVIAAAAWVLFRLAVNARLRGYRFPAEDRSGALDWLAGRNTPVR